MLHESRQWIADCDRQDQRGLDAKLTASQISLGQTNAVSNYGLTEPACRAIKKGKISSKRQKSGARLRSPAEAWALICIFATVFVSIVVAAAAPAAAAPAQRGQDAMLTASRSICLAPAAAAAAVLEAKLRRTGQPQVRRSQLSKSDHIYHSTRRTSGCRHHCFSQMIREACVHYQHTIYNHRMVNLFSKSRTHFVGRSVVHRQQDQTPHVFIGRYTDCKE